MATKPWKIASDKQVRDRLRRMPNNALTREAKRLANEENDTLGALQWLQKYNVVLPEHVAAHQRWLDQQSGEDLV